MHLEKRSNPRVDWGVVVHHGNEDGMGIWFKRIDERSKEFIRMFVRDYL
jgi:hypothetical protein